MSKTDDEEPNLFRKIMTDVKPLKKSDRIYFAKKHKIPKVKKWREGEEEESFLLLNDVYNPEIESEEEVSFARNGVDICIFKKLENRTLPIAATLDLHGKTQEEARVLLTDFIHYCYQHQLRYVRIVHGKGLSTHSAHPIIKNQVCHWLPQFPEVLAFQSAAQRDGGSGAMYVLLKSS